MYFGKEKKCLAEIKRRGCGLERGKKASYWISYDRDRMVVKYGKGYYMQETTILQYDFMADVADIDAVREKYYRLFNAEDQMLVELYYMKPEYMIKPPPDCSGPDQTSCEYIMSICE